ncbi:hypothetical protein RM533_10010 [Croceicoccus sp. F390]|uniref:Terminase n=1 Tax=Croceicoccus esteveae TaxID=3075597 RepID=A0ABU2ZIT6_9SPHN|nr:hypothetical protein [Croceicoccus sp. F390]MDT0576521.1 hypothetical protein [Croceicoccus sp. F390]
MAKGKAPASKGGNDDWRERFLDALSRTSNVAASARAAKMDVSTVYKARQSESEFARRWFAALCDGYDAMEMDLLHRLRAGTVESSEAKRKRKYDNASAMRLLVAHRTTVGKIRAMRDQEDEQAALDSINAKLDMMRDRMQAANRLQDVAGAKDEEQNSNKDRSDDA